MTWARISALGDAALPENETARGLQRVRAFTEFTADSDPHGEHDFDAFNLCGQKFFWKIDDYAPDMDGGSEDASDPDQTIRVLTIMLASEY